jgi:flagellar assembly protein FliH
MAGIIKAHAPATPRSAASPVAFNYDDVTTKASAYIADVKAEAAQIIAKAHKDAETIRKQAQEQGTKNAQDTAEKAVAARLDAQVKAQMQTALPALEQMIQTISTERLRWLQQWEQDGVRLAIGIAEKIIRQRLSAEPNIALKLLREALELAAGSQSLQVRLNPQDHAALGKQVDALVKQLGRVSTAEIVPDETVSPGGCVVQSEFGSIDQRIESQLARIAEELF